jgi:hypothetical protein
VRKWLPILPILLALALTALAYRDLPAVVYPAWGRVLPVTLPDEPMARAGFALLMPLVALGVWGLFAAIARVRGARDGRLPEHLAAAAIARFEPTYHVVVLGVVTLVALLHVALLAATLGWPDWTVQAVGVALGAGLVLVGNLVPRVRPNWIVGIRTPATLRDPDLWLRAHRYFGGLLMVAGLVVIVVAVVAVRFALVALLAGILVAAVLAHWRATRGGSGAVRALALVASVLLPVRAAAQDAPDPRESAFDVRTTGMTLPGTLTLPAGSRPDVVLIVAGSGPTDRNGNGPLVQTDLYRQVARGLADSGFASLRYDKRGLGPASLGVDPSSIVIDGYVGDLAAAVDTLLADGRVGRVFLLGHSEGAMLSVLAGNRGAPVAGIILLAGTGRPLREVVHDQLALQVDSATTVAVDSAFAAYLRGETPQDPPAIAAPLLQPQYRRLLAGMAAYDPEREVAALRPPVLLVGGTMDIQTTRKDFDRLRAARPDAPAVLLEGANHVFKTAASMEPAAQVPLYRDASLPVVPGLVPALVGWLRGIP